MKTNHTTFNGGTIRVASNSLPVFPVGRQPLLDEVCCPLCDSKMVTETVDIVQFGITSDMHDWVITCDDCHELSVYEFEVKA